MTILLTGFDRFGDLPFNPSELVVRQLAKDPPSTNGEHIQGKILSTAYAVAGTEIETLIGDTQPSIVLGFGVSRSRDKICLERFALNLDDAGIGDNAGCEGNGEEIEDGGPAALKTNVDITAVLTALIESDVDDVGESFYRLRGVDLNIRLRRAHRCVGLFVVATPVCSPCRAVSRIDLCVPLLRM